MSRIVRRTLQKGRTVATFSARRASRLVRGLPPRREGGSYNGLFYRNCEQTLAREKASLETFDLTMFRRLNSPRLLGQIVFEYGTLLHSQPPWSTMKILDIGTGASSFPDWMAVQGADVTTLDLASPVEEEAPGGPLTQATLAVLHRSRRRQCNAPTKLIGTMFALDMPDDTFDLVTSLSVLEHVDTRLPSREYVPYEEQQELARLTLDEMIRVTKPGVRIYLTSETCDYESVESDAWRPHYYYDEGPMFSAAWPVQDVRHLFYDYVVEKGCRLVGSVAFSPEAVLTNPSVHTFRGKYWSAFSLLAQKTWAGKPAYQGDYEPPAS
jgi:hypothetical protein